MELKFRWPLILITGNHISVYFDSTKNGEDFWTAPVSILWGIL